MAKLTLDLMKTAAKDFARKFSLTPITELFATTDGKAVGTYVEHAFHRQLAQRYSYKTGSSASGIDFPELEVDVKVTSIRQPQSSSPFRDAGQKVYGLGYHLLVFVYEKRDDHKIRKARVKFRHVVFVSRERTGDYQTTYGLLGILRRNGNKDDLVAFLEERNLPLDEVAREALADRILREPPELGYLTVSNALQWRLQYGRALVSAADGRIPGVENLLA